MDCVDIIGSMLRLKFMGTDSQCDWIKIIAAMPSLIVRVRNTTAFYTISWIKTKCSRKLNASSLSLSLSDFSLLLYSTYAMLCEPNPVRDVTSYRTRFVFLLCIIFALLFITYTIDFFNTPPNHLSRCYKLGRSKSPFTVTFK